MAAAGADQRSRGRGGPAVAACAATSRRPRAVPAAELAASARRRIRRSTWTPIERAGDRARRRRARRGHARDRPGARGVRARAAAPAALPAIAAGAALYLAWLEHRAGTNRHALDLARARCARAGQRRDHRRRRAAWRRDVAAAGAEDTRGPRIGHAAARGPAGGGAGVRRGRARAGRGHQAPPAPQHRGAVRDDPLQGGRDRGRGREVPRGGRARRARRRSRATTARGASTTTWRSRCSSSRRRSSSGSRRWTCATSCARAVFYLKKAVAECVACLDAPQTGDSELWRLRRDRPPPRARRARRRRQVSAILAPWS